MLSGVRGSELNLELRKAGETQEKERNEEQGTDDERQSSGFWMPLWRVSMMRSIDPSVLFIGYSLPQQHFL